MTNKINRYEQDKKYYYQINARHIKHVIFLLVFFFLPSIARADTCLPIGTAQMVFGRYDPTASMPLDIDTTVEFYCPPAFQGRAIIATIQLLPNGNRFNQSIINTSGSGQLEVGVFSDRQRYFPIDSNTTIPILDFNSQSKTFRIILYGRIFQKQKNVDIGNYLGQLSLKVTFRRGTYY